MVAEEGVIVTALGNGLTIILTEAVVEQPLLAPPLASLAVTV